MKVSRLYEVKLPSRGTSKSAGLDFYIPGFSEAFLTDLYTKNKDVSGWTYSLVDKTIDIYPHGKLMIPLGIRVEVPEGRALIAFNKTGVSWKDNIINLSAVVDEDYQGQLFLTLTNYSQQITTLHAGQKIIQLLCIPVDYVSVEEVPDAELHTEETERGHGALGSTGAF